MTTPIWCLGGYDNERPLDEITPRLGKKTVTHRQYIEALEKKKSRYFPWMQAQGCAGGGDHRGYSSCRDSLRECSIS